VEALGTSAQIVLSVLYLAHIILWCPCVPMLLAWHTRKLYWWVNLDLVRPRPLINKYQSGEAKVWISWKLLPNQPTNHIVLCLDLKWILWNHLPVGWKGQRWVFCKVALVLVLSIFVVCYCLILPFCTLLGRRSSFIISINLSPTICCATCAAILIGFPILISVRSISACSYAILT